MQRPLGPGIMKRSQRRRGGGYRRSESAELSAVNREGEDVVCTFTGYCPKV